jgi:hypothetical protein
MTAAYMLVCADVFCCIQTCKGTVQQTAEAFFETAALVVALLVVIVKWHRAFWASGFMSHSHANYATHAAVSVKHVISVMPVLCLTGCIATGVWWGTNSSDTSSVWTGGWCAAAMYWK